MRTSDEGSDGGMFGAVRSTTGNVQASLADKLDAGAAALRNRLSSDELPNGEGARERLAVASTAVADRLEGGALWLRENDVTDLRTLIGRQLAQHPGRTALVALGLGILIGRSSKR
jgi:hypothetical protein